jgi:hypothetical protein
MDESTTGILVNHRSIIDAVTYRSQYMEVIFDDSYQNGNAISTTIPNMQMMSITLSTGDYVGNYELRVLGVNNLRIIILQDGNATFDTNIINDSTLHTTPSKIINKFLPSSEYEIRVLSTPLTTSVLPSVLDLIQLDPVADNVLLNGYDSGGHDLPQVIQTGSLTITGNNTPSNTKTITFENAYTNLLGLFLQSASADYVTGIDSYTYDGSSNVTAALIRLSSRTNTNWSGTVSFNYMAIGEIVTPFMITDTF